MPTTDGSEPQVALIDVSRDLELEFVYRNGEDQKQATILESLGGVSVSSIMTVMDGRTYFFLEAEHLLKRP